MSSVLSNSKPLNPYFREFEDQVSALPETCRCLVISHNDSQLVARMSQSLDEHSAMLQIPHTDWDFENPWLADIIRWGLGTAGVTQIALVGHSAMGVSRSIAMNGGQELTSSESPGSKQPSIYDRLIDGVTQCQKQIAQSKEFFAKQYQKFLKIPEVIDRKAGGNLEIYGLFYLADSGVFLAYDDQFNTFHPLIQSPLSS